MTDVTAAPENGAAPMGPQIRVLSQFVKDLSFENPALAQLEAGPQPSIDLGIDVKAEPLQQQDAIYNVDLKMTARATRNGQVIFLAELVYASVFQMRNVPAADLEPILLIECPRLMFPFARRILAEVTREGGYPPLLVDPIDFVALYRQQVQHRAGRGSESAS